MKKRSKRNKRSKRSIKNLYDGTDRFKIKNIVNIHDDLIKDLNEINKNSKLKYYYKLDFTDEKEYKELINEKNLDKIKFKLDNYINFVKDSKLYPEKYLQNFKKKYLKGLLKIQENINNILIMEHDINNYPRLSKQESYEEVEGEYLPETRKYRHKSDKRRSRIIVKNKIFDIIDNDDENL